MGLFSVKSKKPKGYEITKVETTGTYQVSDGHIIYSVQTEEEAQKIKEAMERN
jgi:uncharacterized membrane-anchored protein YitT (DUF2179 family)